MTDSPFFVTGPRFEGKWGPGMTPGGGKLSGEHFEVEIAEGFGV